MIMLNPMIAVPVALKELLTVITRFHPTCAGERRAGPVSVVPFVSVANGIPVAVYPGISGSGTAGLNANHTRTWRRSHSNPNRDLGVNSSHCEKCQYG